MFRTVAERTFVAFVELASPPPGCSRGNTVSCGVTGFGGGTGLREGVPPVCVDTGAVGALIGTGAGDEGALLCPCEASAGSPAAGLV